MTLKHISREVLAQFDDLQEEGMPDIVIEAINSFLNTSAILIQEMHEAAVKQNWNLAAKKAHALKSSALVLGATDLGHLCDLLETKAGEAAIQSILEDLEKKIHLEYDAAIKEMKTILHERENQSKN